MYDLIQYDRDDLIIDWLMIELMHDLGLGSAVWVVPFISLDMPFQLQLNDAIWGYMFLLT